jgi:hypothetical protein
MSKFDHLYEKEKIMESDVHKEDEQDCYQHKFSEKDAERSKCLHLGGEIHEEHLPRYAKQGVKVDTTKLLCLPSLEETCVILAPIEKVWNELKSFKYDQLFASSCKSIRFINGNGSQIGSTLLIEGKDGIIATYIITEISELKHKYTFELIESKPQQSFTSLSSTMKLKKITHDNSTLVTWETFYSNDVTPEIISKRKIAVQSCFCDMKSILEKEKPL